MAPFLVVLAALFNIAASATLKAVTISCVSLAWKKSVTPYLILIVFNTDSEPSNGVTPPAAPFAILDAIVSFILRKAIFAFSLASTAFVLPCSKAISALP